MPIKYTGSKLKKRAIICEVTYTTNADFERVPAIEERATVWGNYNPQAGRETMQAEQITGEPRAIFTIRFRDWVTTNHVLKIDGVLYEIHAAPDIEGRRRYLELIISKRTTDLITE